VSRREGLLFLAVAAAAVLALPLIGGAVFWTHPFWTDEWCCTIYPVQGASSPLEVIANVAKPQDYAPPLLHLIVWTVGKLTGGLGPVALRSIPIAGVVLCALFVYATLRSRFDWWASAAGSLAAISHQQIVRQAFEARFYGPWLCFVALYAWSLTQKRRWVQALAAVCVVSIHWFGVISLGFLALAAFASFGRSWRAALRHLAPSAAGLVLLLLLLPMVLSQGRGSSAFSWIAPLTAAQVVGVVNLYLWTQISILAITLAVIVHVVQSAAPTRPTPLLALGASALRNPGVTALLGLAAMPLGIVFVSLVLSPAMIPRYNIVAALALAPLVALAVHELPRVAKAAAFALLIVPLVTTTKSQLRNWRGFAEGVAAQVKSWEYARTVGVPVVFASLHEMYQVLGARRGEPMPARFLELSDSTIRALYPSDRLAWLRNLRGVEVRSGVSHSRVYGFPPVVRQAELDTMKLFVLFAHDLMVTGGAKQSENWGRVAFPRHRVVRINEHVSMFELRK